ncbi:MAG: ABC transporter substrate-binding protein [Halanaerobiales bacterium]
MKNYILKYLFFILLFSLFIHPVTSAQEITDNNIPRDWYHEPKTASEFGITSFEQSPYLDEKVKEGILPPVEERLPEDPPVIIPYENTGKYGGTALVWTVNLKTSSIIGEDAAHIGNIKPTAGRPSPDGSKILPYFIKDWSYANNAKELTLYLRPGIKFSDGTSFTAEDYIYWWKYEANNKELNPVPPSRWSPPLLDVVKENRYKITFIYGKPNPNAHNFMFKDWMGPEPFSSKNIAGIASHKFMKKFHPDLSDEKKIENLARNNNLKNWAELYHKIKNESSASPDFIFQRPVLHPYIVTERTESYALLERNPYYPFIDNEGNQLPYIDQIKVQLASYDDLINSQVAMGKATFSAYHLQTNKIPLYKNYEKESKYDTRIYHRGSSTDLALHFNLTHKDPELREIFQDARFRKAISLAINREKINQDFFFGLGVPRQNTVSPLNDLYDDKYANAWTNYNPEKSKKLLDEIGLRLPRDPLKEKINNLFEFIEFINFTEETYRRRPDGTNFKPTLVYSKMDSFNPGPILEMIKSQLEEIGINITLKEVSRERLQQLCQENNIDITIGNGGNFIDLTFGDLYNLSKTFAPTSGFINSWPAWSSWYTTDRENGIEPPDPIKDLIVYAKTLNTTSDHKTKKEIGQKLIKSQSENLWSIGIVGSIPHPVVVSNNLQNVPEQGYWIEELNYMKPKYPEQFYLKD